ncbi:potassium transporter TrkH [Anaplasma marginale str. Dawn]|uniref:TrkH family potassium uptake protein n=1 Tax=Anaplasma marginale TaxID=770 RepID=UPI0003C2914C|nr:TrkH family potassium uptake protein [Anaplasma marginale]AGZ79153.1 potassium transporter TrkH [Anaplasma marginale str. Gypsy Plains]AGZ79953.1 potassium transporter TrkH [Anaplasma marginale str. Dawn]
MSAASALGCRECWFLVAAVRNEASDTSLTRWRALVFVQGAFSLLFALFLLVPMAVDFFMGGEDWEGFATAFSVSAVVGSVCLHFGKSGPIGRHETVYLICAVWTVLSILAAIPFLVSETAKLSYADALFEAVSGLTTTGATVLYNLQAKSPGILLWRVMLNFIGGLGVIAIGVLLLPCLKVVGLKDIYGVESATARQRFKLSVFRTVLYISCMYAMLLVLCTGAYKIAGMSAFDAICHAMSTVSTGGFANYDSSLGHFNSAAIEIVAIVFMLLSSCPFVVYLRLALEGRFRSKQFVVFVCVLVVFSLLGAVNLYSRNMLPEAEFPEVLRRSAFILVSLATSTGFSNCDYSSWGFLAVSGTILTLCGGCSGSTNSGLKMHRIVILVRGGYRYVKHMLMRTPFTVSEQSAREEALPEAGAFFFLYVFVFCIACIIVAWSEDDLATIVTSVSSTFTNTGPGIGDVVGPHGTYAPVSATVKFVLTVLMLIGRLELVPVFVLILSLLRGGAGRLLGIGRGAKMLDMFR